MTVSMGLAMVAAGVTAASVAELRRAHADFAKTKVEYTLAEAQQRGVVDLLRNTAAGRLAWKLDTDLGEASLLAEPEYAKASFTAAAKADDRLLNRLGVQDTDALKARLAEPPPETGGQAWIVGLDGARLWRVCAPSLVSRYGQGETLALAESSPPAGQGFSWRPGEVWRVRASLAGWVEDRIVRLTGDDQGPAAIIERRFARDEKGEGRCEAVFSQAE